MHNTVEYLDTEYFPFNASKTVQEVLATSKEEKQRVFYLLEDNSILSIYKKNPLYFDNAKYIECFEGSSADDEAHKFFSNLVLY